MAIQQYFCSFLKKMLLYNIIYEMNIWSTPFLHFLSTTNQSIDIFFDPYILVVVVYKGICSGDDMIRTDMAKSVADRIQVRLYYVHCTLYIEQLAPYTLHLAPYAVHFTLYQYCVVCTL